MAAFGRLSRERQITYAKISHRLLQTNSRNYSFYGTSAVCLICESADETFAHMLVCEYGSSHSKAEVLKGIKTPERVRTTILHGLEQWTRNQQEGRTTQSLPAGLDKGDHVELEEAYLGKTYEIGWEPFLLGRVHSKWGEVMQKDKSEHEVKVWLCDLVRANMEYRTWLVLRGNSRNCVSVFGRNTKRMRTINLVYQELDNDATDESG